MDIGGMFNIREVTALQPPRMETLMRAVLDGMTTMTWQEVQPRLKLLTYRQIDYWIRTNAIDLQGPAQGSGSKRAFSQEDVWRLQIVERLVDLPSMTSGIPGELIRLLWDYLEGRHRRLSRGDATHVYITGNPRKGWKVSTKLDPTADAAEMLRIR